jgi:hypothetical protein
MIEIDWNTENMKANYLLRTSCKRELSEHMLEFSWVCQS